ncbi:MAG: serine/threonine-protein phosphatase [Akkermansiaceae bacterium]|nr:serine/threonine-protein phosphatase [Akkermansiaceae bacterium]NNM29241.1 serine/threonine-protein phosphatase [Akkermansiaceae bacterium]
MLFEADLEEPRVLPLPCGAAAIFSRPNPVFEKPNQDAAAVIPAGPDDVILVVADGMGGTRQGGAAAATVIRQIAGKFPVEPDELLVRTAILNGIEEANQKVLAEFPSSGTTLAAVEIKNHTIRPYHVGDSVIIVVGQRGKLKLQTISHSPVGFAMEAGLLDEKEALQHDERHIISNAVGLAEMRIELGAPLELARHDTVLLASDGLTDNLRLEEIVDHIRTGPLQKGLAELATLARKRMNDPAPGKPSKPDDLTILAYRREG